VRRFTITPDRIRDGRVAFDRDESRHLARVLRLKPGDTVIAADGAGHDFTVRLEDVAETVTGTVLGVARRDAESPLRITLVQSVPKGDKMEAIVRAATELGAARVVPVTTERTIVTLEPSRWRERARRWQRVAKEAAKQCGRAVIPAVDVARPLAEFLALDEPADLRLCLWEAAAPGGGGGGGGGGGEGRGDGARPGAAPRPAPRKLRSCARGAGGSSASGPGSSARRRRARRSSPSFSRDSETWNERRYAKRSRLAPVSGHPLKVPAPRHP
jgi:16S rRNA (uracil1498-N3)-methyltransferase